MAKAKAAPAPVQAAAETKPVKPAAEKKEKAAPKPKEVNGKPLTTRITFGTDKEGKEYNASDNNPKRRKAGERFANYKKNQKIEDAIAIDGGPTQADVKWDLDKGFIKFVE